MTETTVNQLTKMIFDSHDVLKNVADMNERRSLLRQALIMGNLHRKEVYIEFRTVGSYLKNIKSIVWGVGEDSIYLKDGIHLPVRSIEKVIL